MTAEARESLAARCRALAEELGLEQPRSGLTVKPLTGGVASDIARVALRDGHVAMKFALPKLKVAEDWRAPVHRNAAEYAWLAVAARICPKTAVRLFGRSQRLHGFVMEFVSGPDVYLWKSALLAEDADRNEAAAVGDIIGRIHSGSARPDFDREPFHNRDDFHALRIEPYLVFTAGRVPDLAPALTQLAGMLYAADRVLVHGDVSPKNILFRDAGPMILDAECATMGDASFDPAFCLNHLVLKAVHLPRTRARLLSAVLSFWQSYVRHVDWEDEGGLEARVSRLLPALMLARVDGKSPVEYLRPDEQATVRRIASGLILRPAGTLNEAIERIGEALGEVTA